jgi:hypothetical protein
MGKQHMFQKRKTTIVRDISNLSSYVQDGGLKESQGEPNMLDDGVADDDDAIMRQVIEYSLEHDNREKTGDGSAIEAGLQLLDDDDNSGGGNNSEMDCDATEADLRSSKKESLAHIALAAIGEAKSAQEAAPARRSIFLSNSDADNSTAHSGRKKPPMPLLIQSTGGGKYGANNNIVCQCIYVIF